MRFKVTYRAVEYGSSTIEADSLEEATRLANKALGDDSLDHDIVWEEPYNTTVDIDNLVEEARGA